MLVEPWLRGDTEVDRGDDMPLPRAALREPGHNARRIEADLPADPHARDHAVAGQLVDPRRRDADGSSQELGRQQPRELDRVLLVFPVFCRSVALHHSPLRLRGEDER